MSIITLEEYKQIKPTDGKDEIISALIPLVEDDYLFVRNKDFDKDFNGDVIYPRGSKLVAADMISFRLSSLEKDLAITSESIGDYSVSYATDVLISYPDSITKRIQKFLRVR